MPSPEQSYPTGMCLSSPTSQHAWGAMACVYCVHCKVDFEDWAAVEITHLRTIAAQKRGTVGTKTELRAALYNLVAIAGNTERWNAELSAAEDVLTKGIARLDELEQWERAITPIVQALALYEPSDGVPCPFCGGNGQYRHVDMCPVIRARQVLLDFAPHD